MSLTKIVPCGNPTVQRLVSEVRRSIPKETFQPILRDDKKYCAWCNTNTITPPRRKYCSDECQTSCSIFCYPQQSEALFYHLHRQNYKCNHCGLDYVKYLVKMKRETVDRYKREMLSESTDWWRRNAKNNYEAAIRRPVLQWAANLKGSYYTNWMDADYKAPESDHIIPIASGGESIGVDNIQILCVDCHKEKSKADRKEMYLNGFSEQWVDHKRQQAEEKRIRQERYDKWLEERAKENGKPVQF